MPTPRHILLSLLTVAGLAAGEAELVIEDRPLHAIDKRLFGHFLERTFGSEGPEKYTDERGELPPEVVAAFQAMDIPVVRFPAGTEVDYTDWTHLIDRAPGRAEPMRTVAHGRDPAKSSTVRFGWHEYMRLAQRLGWETIAVTNLLDGMAKRKPLAEAALHAAGLVAYLNAPQGAKLPEGMPDWPAIRAANGHPEPFKVRYIQLGNEWFIGRWKDEVRKALGEPTPEQLGAWYAEVLRAHVQAIRAVDPDIEIIMDLVGRFAVEQVLPDPLLRREVRYVAVHLYAPWSTDRMLTRRKVEVATDEVKPTEVSEEELWQAWSAMPGVCDDSGQNQGLGAKRVARARELGYRVAVTEWNFACFGTERMPPGLDTHLYRAAGVGTAQFLHGLMRQGDAIDIGIQSMLIGSGWNFVALRFTPDGRMSRPPQGQMTVFYNRHHGPRLLASRLTGVAVEPGTLSIGWAFAQPGIAAIDALATGGDGRYVAHLVNRTRAPLPVTIRTPVPSGSATVHRLLPCAVEDKNALSWFTEDALSVPVAAGACRIELPAMAVIAVEFAP